jgi:hypothetical protein
MEGDLLWHLENDGKHIQRRRTAADGELVDAALNEWREAVAMFSGARISSAVIPWDSWSACMREIERLRSDNDSLVASLDAQRERTETLKAARQRDRKTIRKIKIVGAVVLCVSLFSVVKAFS